MEARVILKAQIYKHCIAFITEKNDAVHQI